MVHRTFNHYSTVRRDMVDDTTRFLDWALQHPHFFPRIPRVRVDSGTAFSRRIRVAFWSSVLLKMNQMSCPGDK